MPALTGVLETSLYVDDLSRASRFYEEVFTLTKMFGDDRLCAYAVAESGRSFEVCFGFFPGIQLPATASRALARTPRQ